MVFVWFLCGAFTMGILFLIYDIIRNRQQENGGSINISDWFQISRFWNMVFSSGGKSNPYNTRRPIGSFHLNGEISESSDWEERPIKKPSKTRNRKSKNKDTSFRQRQRTPAAITFHTSSTTSIPVTNFDTGANIGWFPNGQYPMRGPSPRTETSDSFGSGPNMLYPVINTPPIRQTSDSFGSGPNMLYPVINTPPIKETSNSFGSLPSRLYPVINTASRRQTSDSFGIFEHVENPMISPSPRSETPAPFGSLGNVENPMGNSSLRREVSEPGSLGTVDNPMRNVSLRQTSVSPGSLGTVDNPMRNVSLRQTSVSPGSLGTVDNPMRNVSLRQTSVSPGSLGNVENPMGNLSLREQSAVSPGSLGRVEDPMRNFSPKKKPSDSIDLSQIPNVAFYQNMIPAAPNKEHINDILTHWIGNYAKLQENTTYLQWLFPNKIAGTNSDAHVLNNTEAKTIRESPTLKNKVKSAFIMMLDCYGMEITGLNQIQLKENYKKRLKQLNKQDSPKFLSITRILLALKELGHHDLMLPWLKCFANLIYKENKLCHARYSFENFWIDTLDAEDKIALDSMLQNI